MPIVILFTFNYFFIPRLLDKGQFRGVKGFFNNYNKEFWSIVSIIVKNKIKRIVQ